jgi:hypothetical protein
MKTGAPRCHSSVEFERVDLAEVDSRKMVARGGQREGPGSDRHSLSTGSPTWKRGRGSEVLLQRTDGVPCISEGNKEGH